MYELIQAAEHTYYIQCPAKMGLWVPDGKSAVLIDSGGDKDAGRKVQKTLEARGWTLSCILNTTPTLTTTAATPCSSSGSMPRPTPRASTPPSPRIPSWRPPSSTAAIPPSPCATSSSSPSPAGARP